MFNRCAFCLVASLPLLWVGCFSPVSSTQTSKVIGSAGGTISAPDGTSIQIPAGALASDLTITITPVPGLAAPANVTWVGTPYSAGPSGTQFDKPVTIILPFSVGRLPVGTPASQVAVFTAEDGSTTFASLGGSPVGAGQVQAQTAHFSYFGPGVPNGGASDAGDAGSEAGGSSGSAVCAIPPSANTFNADAGVGCQPQPTMQSCVVPNGSTVGPGGPPDGSVCTDLCTTTEFSLVCTKSEPAPSLSCRVLPLPTPQYVSVECCACAP